ncbi:hypothetical protein UlMin_035750 [Ulmus minor]
MAPLPNEVSTAENSKAAAANLVPNCTLLISSSAKFMPFLRPPSNKKLNNLASSNVVAIGELLQTSISSVADNCLKFLHTFSSENLLLHKVFSLHSECNSFCHQVHFRNSRNVNSISNHNFALILGDPVAGVVVANGVLNFLNIYSTLLVVRLVLTWFPNSPPAIVSPLRCTFKTSEIILYHIQPLTSIFSSWKETIHWKKDCHLLLFNLKVPFLLGLFSQKQIMMCGRS